MAKNRSTIHLKTEISTTPRYVIIVLGVKWRLLPEKIHVSGEAEYKKCIFLV